MRVPTNLNHTPIVSVDDYEQIDGCSANDTDARALSLGFAQYENKSRPRSLTLKVFRKANDKWSRQSEELPLHRVLDLSILLLRSIAQDPNALSQSPLSVRMNGNNPQNRAVIVHLCKADRQFLLPRIEELKYLLNTIDYKTLL